ncbi:unnamed protein product [Candidula unifasciata]|uniref:C2H2-type domain-containing protein n=1 Tax=Candidula unifasciata TaxID=100452 RepID=A0A8S3YP04_9EUPU|nr:unnamed protein product [Candidula unifasciata]
MVSTSLASKRAELEQRISNRSYTPDERSDTAAMANGKGDKDASAFTRSVSSDEGSHSPEDNHMEINGDEEMMQHDHEMAEHDNDDETDIDDRNYPGERDYSDMRRFSQNGERSMAEKERDRDRDFGPRNPRCYEDDLDKEKRGHKKERNPSGGSGSSDKNSNGNLDRDADFDGQDRDGNYDNQRMYDSPHNGRSGVSRTSINRHDQSSPGQSSSKEKRLTKSLSSIFANVRTSSSGDNSSNINNTDLSDLRPPKRHIERQNLNTRMIPSSSSRKQRHPMRRFSSAGSEQESPQSGSSLPVSSTTAEAIERGEIDDNDLVTFLLTKGRVHKCVHCHMIFEDASLFLLHNGFHSHDDPFRCVVCSTVCKDRVDFNCHLTSHIK